MGKVTLGRFAIVVGQDFEASRRIDRETLRRHRLGADQRAIDVFRQGRCAIAVIGDRDRDPRPVVRGHGARVVAADADTAAAVDEDIAVRGVVRAKLKQGLIAICIRSVDVPHHGKAGQVPRVFGQIDMEALIRSEGRVVQDHRVTSRQRDTQFGCVADCAVAIGDGRPVTGSFEDDIGAAVFCIDRLVGKIDLDRRASRVSWKEPVYGRCRDGGKRLGHIACLLRALHQEDGRHKT